MRIPVAKDSLRFIIPCLGIAAGLFLVQWYFLFSVFIVLTAAIAFFFRDPERAVISNGNSILSPADGKIVSIGEKIDDITGAPSTCISVFLSILNVHVNRSPISGKIVNTRYREGKFVPAFQPGASSVNEQNSIVIQGEGMKIGVTQIAGLIARRIVCWVKNGDTLHTGQRIGLIRFGSRVDVYIPTEFILLVKIGDRVKGGVTILAKR